MFPPQIIPFGFIYLANMLNKCMNKYTAPIISNIANTNINRHT